VSGRDAQIRVLFVFRGFLFNSTGVDMLKKSILGVLSVGCLSLGLIGGCKTVDAQSEWTNLFDKDMSNFETWIGTPYKTVEGLPEGTFQTDNVKKGTAMGLNNDVKNVFSMIEEDGKPVLRISGEIYGGLTTLSEFENYHLSIKVKWGEQKWVPRLKAPGDSGILYHCHGDHGTAWGAWKLCIECQVQESDLGDFVGVGTTGQVRSSKKNEKGRPYFDPSSEKYNIKYISANPEPDMPHGECNTMEIYTVGNTSVHMVNGQVVMVVENAKKKDGTPLTRGQIQLQSEGAEVFYTEMKIRNITDFPAEIKSQLKLKDWKL
jgi:hypothetical protein